MKSCASPIGAALNDASHKVNGRAACAPGNLHPGGFGVCPLALMLDERATPTHLAVYLALASTLSGQSASGAPYLGRVAERGRVSVDTAQRRIADLEAWGYVIVRRRHGCRSEYLLCPTAAPGALGTNRTGAASSDATDRTGAATPPDGCGQTSRTGAATPQIQDQSSIQTRGTPPTPLEGAAPAPTDGAGGSPPTPPFPDLSVDLRKFLDYHGWLGDASFVGETVRVEQRDGTRAAIRGVEVAMHYGLRPRAPVPASEGRA